MAVTLSIDGTKIVLNDGLDTDDDGIAETAASVRSLDALPSSPESGEIVEKDGKLYIAMEE